jgi:thymidylate kinase
MSDLTPDRLKILAFEGPDKVGKSTIIRELNLRTNYEYLCIDRFIGSAWVYDALSRRRHRGSLLASVERELAEIQSVQLITILLMCEREVLLRRIADADEEPATRIAQLDQAIKLYEDYSRHFSPLPLVKIDTTFRSVTETVSEIIMRISEL